MTRHVVDPEEFDGFTVERGGRGSGYDVDRFRKKATIENEIDCWPWHGKTNTKGQPMFWDSHLQRPMSAARWSFEYFIGPVPSGFRVTPCRADRSCVNPFHLVAEAMEAGFGPRTP